MERCCRLVLLLLCTLCAITLACGADIAPQCDAATEKITAQVQAQQYVEAMNSAAEYEMALRAAYPAPTYEDGVFRCAAYHLTFRNPIATLQLNRAATLSARYKAIGKDLLADLVNADETDRIRLFVFDTNVINKRMDCLVYDEKTTDTAIRSQAKGMVGNLGALSDGQFLMAGPHRVLLTRVTTSALEPPQWLVTLAQKNQYYFFLRTAPNTAVEQSSRELLQLVSTVTWDYNPPNRERIAATRAQHDGSIAQTLTCAKELALLGEYGSAAEEISGLRSMLAEKFPKPYLEKNCAYLPAYQVALRNPNPATWAMTVNDDAANTIILFDKTVAIGRGVQIQALSLNQAFGIGFVRELNDPQGAEDRKKNVLRGSGRGGLLAICRGPILSESFTTFNGQLAYQGIANSTSADTRMKLVVTFTPRALIMVIYLAPTSSFSKDIARLETITANYLTIK